MWASLDECESNDHKLHAQPKFIKVCKVQNFVIVIQDLLEKLQVNLKLIEVRRQK